MEGGELDVLRGLDAAAWRITRQVAAEVHDVEGRLAAVQCLLEQHGFAVHAERQAATGNWLVWGWQLEGGGAISGEGSS